LVVESILVDEIGEDNPSSDRLIEKPVGLPFPEYLGRVKGLSVVVLVLKLLNAAYFGGHVTEN
jgi:hypothetical protein